MSDALGYVGFSNSWMAVEGAHALSASFSMWPPIENYGGGVIQDWADPSSVDGQVKWGAFHAALRQYGAGKLWIQVGSKLHKEPRIEKNLRTVIELLRKDLPTAPFFVSAVNSYASDCSGFTRIAWQECATAVHDVLADKIPHVYAGPVMPQLSHASTIDDGIHPSPEIGIPLLGATLVGFNWSIPV